MKQMLLMFLLLPALAMAQDKQEKKHKDWDGWMIKDCQNFAISELTAKDGEAYKEIGADYINENTKVIYISRQPYLKDKEILDTLNGYAIKFIDVDSNYKWLAKEIKEGAAVYYMTNLHMDANVSDIYIFPITIKTGMFGAKKEYATKSVRLKFFYNYDPPKFEYKGLEVVDL
ncbi:MAG: hypothetical protein H6551_12645 [Chitinophagales bacterium]|nr:hypothetical protein [Chitinophagaceae bacterium]MCB9065980.1 hypothetical protein [Chitinophagales bacterium]